MKLKSIAARNFKGLTFNEPLALITVLIGANFAGKSARTDAIRLLLLGYLPELGKNARDTFGLSSGKEMEVSGTFDNGLTIRRRFYLKGDTVKTEDEIPQEIADCGLLAVMLNAEEYFALSDRGRVDYVFANVAMSAGFTNISIIKRLEDELEVLDGVNAPLEKVLTMLTSDLEFISPQQWIEGAITLVGVAQKDAKVHGDRMEKTIQGLVGLRMADDKSGVDLPSLEVKITKLRADVDELNLKKNALSVRYELMINGRERRRSIEVTLGQMETVKAKITTEKGKRDVILEQLAKMPDSAEAIEKLLEIKHTANTQHTAAEISVREAKAAIASARGHIRSMDEEKHCPYCGAAGDGWKALKLAEWNTQIEMMEKALPDFLHAQKTAKESFNNADRDLESLRANRRKAELLEGDERVIEREVSMLERQVAREADLREELGKLPVDDSQLETDVDMIQTELNVKNEEILDADTKRKSVMGRAQELQRLAQAETDRDTAKADAAIAADVVKELRKIQGEMVESAFKPLLDLANSFFGDVFKSPLAYHEGEIGTWREGVWVTHRTMSGTEKALTYAAIQAALASKSPVKIMMIDELARLDDENLADMMAGVACAIAEKKIDGFIGIDTGRAELYRQQAVFPAEGSESDGGESSFLVREIG